MTKVNPVEAERHLQRYQDEQRLLLNLMEQKATSSKIVDQALIAGRAWKDFLAALGVAGHPEQEAKLKADFGQVSEAVRDAYACLFAVEAAGFLSALPEDPELAEQTESALRLIFQAQDRLRGVRELLH